MFLNFLKKNNKMTNNIKKYQEFLNSKILWKKDRNSKYTIISIKDNQYSIYLTEFQDLQKYIQMNGDLDPTEYDNKDSEFPENLKVYSLEMIGSENSKEFTDLSSKEMLQFCKELNTVLNDISIKKSKKSYFQQYFTDFLLEDDFWYDNSLNKELFINMFRKVSKKDGGDVDFISSGKSAGMLLIFYKK